MSLGRTAKKITSVSGRGPGLECRQRPTKVAADRADRGRGGRAGQGDQAAVEVDQVRRRAKAGIGSTRRRDEKHIPPPPLSRGPEPARKSANSVPGLNRHDLERADQPHGRLQDYDIGADISRYIERGERGALSRITTRRRARRKPIRRGCRPAAARGRGRRRSHRADLCASRVVATGSGRAGPGTARRRFRETTDAG